MFGRDGAQRAKSYLTLGAHITRQIIRAPRVEAEQKCESVGSLSVLAVSFHVTLCPPPVGGVILTLDYVEQSEDVMLGHSSPSVYLLSLCPLPSHLPLLTSPPLCLSPWGFSLQQVASQSVSKDFSNCLTPWQQAFKNNTHIQMHACAQTRTLANAYFHAPRKACVHIHDYKLTHVHKVANLAHTHTCTITHLLTHSQFTVMICLQQLQQSVFFNPSPRGNIFKRNNQFNTSRRIRQTVSKWLELDQTLMLNAIPQQQVLNTNLISVSRGQASAWCLSRPPAASWREQRQRQQRQQQRMHGKESSSQNWGHDKCTEQDCDILPSRDSAVQLFSTCVSLTIPRSLSHLMDTFIQSV